MDTRADFQRLLEDMDKVIQAKRQELVELDERLESARDQLSAKEAEELKNAGEQTRAPTGDQFVDSQQRAKFDSFIDEQRKVYEQQLEQFSEELTELESINQELVKENSQLRSELKLSLERFEDLKLKSQILTESLEEVQSANLELNLRLAKAESETRMQQRLLVKLHKEDEVLMTAFNDKLDSLKKAIEWRDEEISRLRLDNKFTLESLGIETRPNGDDDDDDEGANEENFEKSGKFLVDSEKKQRVLNIASAFKDKDAQIELLKQQLIQATKDLEKNATLLELLNKEQKAPLTDSINYTSIQDLSDRCKMLENELEVKDRQVHLVEFKNRQYETVLPNKISNLVQKLIEHLDNDGGLQWKEELNIISDNLNKLLGDLNSTRDLLNKIDQVENDNQVLEAQIKRLVNELNQFNAKYDHVLHLLHLNGIQFNEQQFDEQRMEVLPMNQKVSSSSNIEHKQQDKSNNNRLESGDKTHQDELIKESREAKRSTTLLLMRKSKGIADHNLINKSKIKNENKATNESERSLERTEVKTMMEAGSDLESNQSLSKNSFDYQVLKQTQDRLKQLESENELLELAMKEILLSIKWSDAQCCTILIDCPSLERLCQLIEAKFLTNFKADEKNKYIENKEGVDLFQFIVLKSELDLLRGQNEQLRADMKIQRKDYYQLLESIKEKEKHLKEETIAAACLEAECQTDELMVKDEMAMVALKEVETKCNNCIRLNGLINHLLQCIVKIETRMQVSDENYLNRLLSLHELNQILERDLSVKEKLLNEAKRDFNNLNQQKSIVESKLQFLEQQSSLYLKSFPQQANVFKNDRNVQVFTATKNGNGDSIHSGISITEGTNNQQADLPIKSARMVITLLQSIIGCLQARIDYKDERLQQLETLLLKQQASPIIPASPLTSTPRVTPLTNR